MISPESGSSPEVIPDKEQKKPTILRVAFIRHAEREGGEGETLSEAGRAQAQKYGKELIQYSDGTKVYCSPKSWTTETAGLIQENLRQKSPYQTRGKDVLVPVFSKGFRDQLFQWRREEGNTAAMAHYLEYGSQKPDENSPSPAEMSRVVAGRLVRFCRIASMNKFAGQELSLPHIAHDFTIMPFVANVFKDQVEANPQNPEGKNIIEKMGGSLKPLEGFEANITKEGGAEPITSLKFRDWTVELTQGQLEEMAKESSEGQES